MAKILTKYNWAAPSVLTRSEKATYPWDEWLDGNIWKLTQGEDFQPHPLMMERIIRTRATGRSAKIRMRHEALNGDEKNPFGIIIMERTDIPAPPKGSKATAAKATTNGKAVKAPAKKVAPAKAAATKAPAKKAPTKAASKPAPTKAARKAAPAKAKAPVKRAPAKRAPRSIKVDGPAPAPSKKAAKKVAASA